MGDHPIITSTLAVLVRASAGIDDDTLQQELVLAAPRAADDAEIDPADTAQLVVR